MSGSAATRGERPAGSSSGSGLRAWSCLPGGRTFGTRSVPDWIRHHAAMSTPEALPPLERPFLHRMRIRAGVALGLLYLIGPVADLARSSLGPLRITGIAIGLAAFVAIYWSLLPPAEWLAQRGQRAIIGALAVMPVVAGALLLAGAPASFASLFVYFAAASG